MLVSFLMPVYDRPVTQPELVGEAVYWFLESQHRETELVVLNDLSGVTVTCDAPGVRVVNSPRGYATLGAKRNALTQLARGEICLPYDDDDISLPNRASQAVRMLEGFDFWSPRRWWYSLKGQPARPDDNGWGTNCCAYRRDKFLGAYRHTHGDEDMHLGADVDGWEKEGRIKVNHAKVGDGELSYVYRWGVSKCHLSGCPSLQADYKLPAVQPCTVKIVPKMVADWAAVVRRC